MIDKKTIEEIKNRLVKTYDPLAIYIFGSYAWGTPTDDSDLDLLVVVDSSGLQKFKRPIKGYIALFDLELSKDLVVYTKDEFDKRSKEQNTLLHKIKNEGKVLYAKA